jgi:hypothetical protein
MKDGDRVVEDAPHQLSIVAHDGVKNYRERAQAEMALPRKASRHRGLQGDS